MFGFKFNDSQKRRLMSIVLIILSAIFGLPAVDSVGASMQRLSMQLDNVARV